MPIFWLKKGKIQEVDLESIAESEKPLRIKNGVIHFSAESIERAENNKAYIFEYSGIKTAAIREGNSLELYAIIKGKYFPAFDITKEADEVYLDKLEGKI